MRGSGGASARCMPLPGPEGSLVQLHRVTQLRQQYPLLRGGSPKILCRLPGSFRGGPCVFGDGAKVFRQEAIRLGSDSLDLRIGSRGLSPGSPGLSTGSLNFRSQSVRFRSSSHPLYAVARALCGLASHLATRASKLTALTKLFGQRPLVLRSLRLGVACGMGLALPVPLPDHRALLLPASTCLLDQLLDGGLSITPHLPGVLGLQ